MSVSLAEYRLGGLRWIVLNGPDREAFGALGEHVREELAALAEAWPVLPRLRRHVSGLPGRDLAAAARRATAESVTAFWYPGFVPANAFALTGDGLVWTVDHLPVASPGPGAGRHFVGRGLQRTARTVDDAVGYLQSRPSAGGFAYTIGDRAGRVVSVEAAAGQHAVTEAGPGRAALLWHTNHGRYLSGAEPETDGTSAARGETLDTLAFPAEDPGPSWFLDILTSP